MPYVLLTGASGFIAAHCLKSCLSRGWKVRFTVRSEEKAKKILEAHLESKDLLDYVIVPDISASNAYKDVFDNGGDALEAIIHTASPFHFDFTDPKTEILDPAIQGTVNLLAAVSANAPHVKRVVITSSFAAIFDPKKGLWPGHTYTETDWNPVTLEEGLGSDKPTTYRASKKLAEQAAWDYVKDNNVTFDLVTLCPPMVFGPVVNNQSLTSLNTSNQRIWDYLSGKSQEVGPDGVHLWIDVRDLAEAHARAVEKADAGGKRFFTVADEIFSNQHIADILHKHYPDRATLIPKGVPGRGLGLKEGEVFTSDNTPSKNVLNLVYRGFEETVIDTSNSLLQLERDSKV